MVSTVIFEFLIEMTEHIFEQNLFEDSLSSNSSLDTTVSRMIADENIIDSFFYICDVDKLGTVAVSKLIEFIINTTDGNIQVIFGSFGL